MEFFRQEYWSGLSFPTAGHLPNPGVEPRSPVSLALADGFFTIEPPGHIRIENGWLRRWPFSNMSFRDIQTLFNYRLLFSLNILYLYISGSDWGLPAFEYPYKHCGVYPLCSEPKLQGIASACLSF